MAITTYRTLGYAGFGKQTAIGTAVAPTKFLKSAKAAFLPEFKASDWSNGNVLDVGFSLKETAQYKGSIQCLCYPDELTALLAYVMGGDTISGAGDPYSHTLALANTLPMLTFEMAYLENQIIDRVFDTKISKLTLDAEAGKPVMVTIELDGLSVAVQVSAATPSFTDGSTEGPIMFYNGVITLTGPTDAAVLSAQVQKISIEIDRNVAVEHGPGQINPIALVEQRRKINVTMQALFSGPNIYDLTHYGSNSGTAFANALGTGSVVAKFTTAAAPEHSILFTIANGTWQMAKPMYDPEGKPGLIDLKLVGYRSGATLPLVVVGKNAIATGYYA